MAGSSIAPTTPFPAFASFGEMLKYLRRRARMTQGELSIAIGYSISQISRLEHNERCPDQATLLAVFVPALRLEHEPALVARLLELATTPFREAVSSERKGAIPGGQHTHPEPKPLDAPPVHNLPHRLTSFVGRGAEIAILRRRIASTRLVTLTGAGGMGKTSLALEIARSILDFGAHEARPEGTRLGAQGTGALRARILDLEESDHPKSKIKNPKFPDGVWLVELAALQETALVTKTMAALFALPEVPDRTPLEVLITYLQSKQLLLLLDNCEHVIATCAAAVDRLLRTCPQLHILATSREALGVDGELEWAVTALPTPELSTGGHQPIKADAIKDYEAVHLFLQRAQTSKSGFVLSEQNAPAIAQICSQLDGMPLALELAAARLKGLTVAEVAARLQDRFALLTGGRRTALLRHQTLRAAMDWSYDLLTEPEQRLFRQLALFAGGWTLDAAEATAADTQAHNQILTLLLQLVSKSLVVADERGGATRYRMLETIRQYAAEKLYAAGEETATHQRHFAYFLALAEAAEPHLHGGAQIVWTERLELEHDNLCAALAWAHAQAAGDGSSTERAEAELRLAGALLWFWDLRDYSSEGRRWLERALVRASPLARTAARATALFAAGYFAANQNDFVAARSRLEESVAIWRELGDKRGLALALSVGTSLGWATLKEHRLAETRTLLAEGVALWRELGDRWGLAFALWSLGAVVWRDDLAAARSIAEESVALFREAGDRAALAYALRELGYVARLEGDYTRAGALLEESLALGRELGSKTIICGVLLNLGEVVQAQGDALHALLALYQESLALVRPLGYKDVVASCLIGVGGVAGAVGQPERATQLLSAAETLYDTIGVAVAAVPVVRDDYDRYVAAARAQLDEATWTAAWAEGQDMTLEQAMVYALETAQS